MLHFFVSQNTKMLTYDVVVCGGGIAGVAAAVAAARQGAKTVLVEKQCLLGGLATSGLIFIYLPLCDGFGKQVTFGLAEEMLRRCVEYGPFDIPEKWGGPKDGYLGIASERFQCCFSPAGFTLTLDKMLEEAGVELWLDTTISDVRTRNNRVTAIEVVNLSGKQTIKGKCFVDATGCAFVARLAGAEVMSEENFVTPWVMEMSEHPEGYHFTESLHIAYFGAFTPEYGIPPEYNGRDVTDFVRKTWRQCRDYYDALPQEARKRNYPVHLPAMPQLRKIARIDAVYNLTDNDAGKQLPHSVGTVGDWRRPAPCWTTPYEALIPKTVDGILAAGRCIGAAGDAWEIYRVIPSAAMTGEAAGRAAALCAQKNILPRKLPFSELAIRN